MEKKPEMEPECCPPFDPAQWDEKILIWENKPFVKDHVFTFLHIPVNFGQVMRRLDKAISSSGAIIPDSICLSDHTSKWNMDVYLAVDRMVPGTTNAALSGKYYSRVYEGPFKDTEKWCNDYKTKVADKAMTIKKWYMWYTTCPKCAKKYGKNYVAIICEVA